MEPIVTQQSPDVRTISRDLNIRSASSWNSVWGELVRKELRLGKPFFYAVLVILALAGVVGMIYAVRYPSGAMSITAAFVLGLHSLYLAAYLMYSLYVERTNAPLWLQNPLPGWVLLSAKCLSGLVYAAFSALLWSIVTGILMRLEWPTFRNHFEHPSEVSRLFQSVLYHQGWVILTLLLLSSVALSALTLCAFMVAAAFRSIVGRWHILLGIVFFFGILLIHTWLMDSVRLGGLLQWGPISTSQDLIQLGKEWTIDSSNTSDGPKLTVALTMAPQLTWIGQELYQLLGAGLLFAAASRILDRHMEV